MQAYSAFAGRAGRSRGHARRLVSTEHVFLALAGKDAGGAQKLLAAAGITKDAISGAAGHPRHPAGDYSEPGSDYQALTKYGRDLTELARKGKLDPVIGRDEALRRENMALRHQLAQRRVLQPVQTRLALHLAYTCR